MDCLAAPGLLQQDARQDLQPPRGHAGHHAVASQRASPRAGESTYGGTMLSHAEAHAPLLLIPPVAAGPQCGTWGAHAGTPGACTAANLSVAPSERL